MRARIGWIGINCGRGPPTGKRRVGDRRAGDRGARSERQARSHPVIPDSVRLTVDGEAWDQIDDLFAAGPRRPRSTGGRRLAHRATGCAVQGVLTRPRGGNHPLWRRVEGSPTSFGVRDPGELRIRGRACGKSRDRRHQQSAGPSKRDQGDQPHPDSGAETILRQSRRRKGASPPLSAIRIGWSLWMTLRRWPGVRLAWTSAASRRSPPFTLTCPTSSCRVR